MKKVLLIIALVAVAGYAGFFYSKQEYQNDYQKGYDSGLLHGKNMAKIEASFYAEDTVTLKEYNDLVDDYNNLLNQVRAYVGTNQYQARQPITCTTIQPLTQYGDITTRCY